MFILKNNLHVRIFKSLCKLSILHLFDWTKMELNRQISELLFFQNGFSHLNKWYCLLKQCGLSTKFSQYIIFENCLYYCIMYAKYFQRFDNLLFQINKFDLQTLCPKVSLSKVLFLTNYVRFAVNFHFMSFIEIDYSMDLKMQHSKKVFTFFLSFYS